MDIAAYLDRINYRGSTKPSLSVLNHLISHHVEHVPFENLDILMGVPIDLSPEAVFDKLVTRRRGGYCFEQNGLFGEVLQQLGFEVQPLSARVRIDRPRSVVPPRTHRFNRVELSGQSYLADVGVGALSPTSALRLEFDVEQPTPHEPRRLVAEGQWTGLASRSADAVVYHQVKLGDEWKDVCDFTLEAMHPVDCELGNWFTSTHPQSHFLSRLMVARATPEGRLSVLNDQFKRRGHSGRGEAVPLHSEEQLRQCLQEHFGLHLPAAPLRCAALPWVEAP